MAKFAYCRLSQFPSLLGLCINDTAHRSFPPVCWAIQTTRTPERGARKQFIYNISGFYSGFGAVFPGIEVPHSTLQCTFPSFSAKSFHLSVNLPEVTPDDLFISEEGAPSVDCCLSGGGARSDI